MFGVWAAPGARETNPKGGGLRPRPFGRVSLWTRLGPQLARVNERTLFGQMATRGTVPHALRGISDPGMPDAARSGYPREYANIHTVSRAPGAAQTPTMSDFRYIF